jgi:hypothetical protein
VGAARSIVIDEGDEILAGNGVVEAARQVGLSRVQVVEVDGQTLVAVRRRNLSPAQKRALALYDNRTAELAEWDTDQLAADRAAGLELQPYWTADEERALFGEEVARAGRTDPDAVPPVRATSIQPGDLFECGSHRLLCGDAGAGASVDRVLAGDRPRLCLTDPPYGLGVAYASFTDTKAAVADLARRWLPLARARAAAVVFSPGVTHAWLYPEPDWVLCWFYGGGQLRSPWGFNCWQPFLCYGADPSLSSGHGGRPDAVDLNVPANAPDVAHPCPKPIALWTWLLNRLTFERQTIVLEPFAGAGTGLIAAEQLARRCLAIELDPQYCQLTLDRWEAFTAGRAVKVGDART